LDYQKSSKEGGRETRGEEIKQSRKEAIKAERNYRMETELGRKGWMKT
jgi:hypothetical protein